MKSHLWIAALALSLGATGTIAAGDVAAGKANVAVCAGCHGANGEGIAQNPPLAGMSQATFVRAMSEYKSGKRPNAMMKTLAAQMTDSETENLAAYYASLKKK